LGVFDVYSNNVKQLSGMSVFSFESNYGCFEMFDTNHPVT